MKTRKKIVNVNWRNVVLLRTLTPPNSDTVVFMSRMSVQTFKFSQENNEVCISLSMSKVALLLQMY